MSLDRILGLALVLCAATTLATDLSARSISKATQENYCNDLILQSGHLGQGAGYILEQDDSVIVDSDPLFRRVGVSEVVHSNANDALYCISDGSWQSIAACLGDTFNIVDSDVTHLWRTDAPYASTTRASSGTSRSYAIPKSYYRGEGLMVHGGVSDGYLTEYFACEANKLYTQSSPVVYSASAFVVSGSISVSVNANMDTQYSRNALNGDPLEYVYRFIHQNPSQTRIIRTSSSSLSQSLVGPEYLVKVKVFDGTYYSNDYNLGVFQVGNEDVTCPIFQPNCSIGGN